MTNIKPALRRYVHGVLLLNKPVGISSNKALQIVKKLYQAEKAGHTGSLDPLASGMLPICFGEATKFSEFLLTSEKIYSVTAKLGIQTTTGDAEGEIVKQLPPPPINMDIIEKLFSTFLGKQTQVPSMYSALKHNGQPLYKLARQGIEVKRSERHIEIYYLHLISHTDDEITFEVKCSKGTYIRSLVEDMGENLGCGAHVAALHRINTAHFNEDQMKSLSYLETLNEDLEKLDAELLPIDAMITSLPELFISEAAYYYLKKGQYIIYPYETSFQGEAKLIKKDGGFLGIGEILANGRLVPRRMVQT